MLHIALIGGGYIGDCHVAAYSAMEPGIARLTAVVDANPAAGEAMAKKAGCRWYPTLEEAAAAEPVDVVDICVPTFLHEPFTLKAAKLGKHVLCEKPATLSVESFDRMERVCREAGVRFMTAQVLRYMPAFAKAAGLLPSLGAVHMASSKRLCQHPKWTNWHRDPARSGGGLYDLNTHDIDYLYSLFGMPVSITSVGWKNADGCWNHVCQLLRWNTHQAVVESSMEMTGDYPFTEELQITADRGTIEYRSKAGANIKEETATTLFCRYPADGAPEAVEIEAYDPFRVMLEAYLRAVEQGTPVPIPPSQTRDVLRILEASGRSLQTGETVYFD